VPGLKDLPATAQLSSVDGNTVNVPTIDAKAVASGGPKSTETGDKIATVFQQTLALDSGREALGMAPEESVVTDEDPLSFLGSQEPSTEKSEPAADARGEAAAAVATNMENPLEYLGTEQTAESQGSLGNPADFAISAADSCYAPSADSRIFLSSQYAI